MSLRIYSPLQTCLGVRVGALIVAVKDYHPRTHVSFARDRAGFLPPHCVQASAGAAFMPGIAEALTRAQVVGEASGSRVVVAYKGFHPDVDSYGAFAYAEPNDLCHRRGILRSVCRRGRQLRRIHRSRQHSPRGQMGGVPNKAGRKIQEACRKHSQWCR